MVETQTHDLPMRQNPFIIASSFNRTHRAICYWLESIGPVGSLDSKQKRQIHYDNIIGAPLPYAKHTKFRKSIDRVASLKARADSR